MTNVFIKNNIQKARATKGMTQEKVAEDLKVTRTYLSKLENNKFSPSPDLMYRVCKYFNKELGEMFYI